ncbi:MAG: DUF4136 domain-containing protein [Spirochaetaceae bacterium]|nr:DUF4136 domain-containing protein [Spirochaetaceae bacterium]
MFTTHQFKFDNKKTAVFFALCFALTLNADAQRNVDNAVKAAPAPKFKADKNGRPNWVNAPYAAYDKKFYLAYTASGQSRENAEAAAFAGLAGYFGQSVTGELSTSESYREERGKKSGASSEQSLDSVVQISTSMNNLAGAEIGALWQDTKDRAWYAVAFMDKAKSAALYSAMLDEKNAALTRMTAHIRADDLSNEVSDKKPAVTLEDIVRLRQAAAHADECARLAAAVHLLGGSRRNAAATDGGEFRRRARALAAAIPVSQDISGADAEGRLAAAFARSLEGAGFSTSSGGARYKISASYHSAPAVLAGQKNTFVRYELTAGLTDTKTKNTLFTWTANGREGHISENEASQRALRAACERVKTEFSAELEAYLSGL